MIICAREIRVGPASRLARAAWGEDEGYVTKHDTSSMRDGMTPCCLKGGLGPIIPPFHHSTLARRAMALNIKNGTAEQLAKELAALTGESVTQAVISALRDRLSAVRRRSARPDLRAEIAGLQAFLRQQPDRDRRGADEIVGYDEYGLPS